MEITWIGISCLRLRGREAEVVVDPLAAGLGRGVRLAPDLVVSTEDATDPALLHAAEGRPQLVAGPGEYEIRGVYVTVRAAGATTIVRIEVDDVRVVCLGRLRRQLTEDEVDVLGRIDVLAVPVGGGDALGATEATRVVNAVEPAIVIPVRHRVEGLPGDYELVDRFAKEMGLAEGWNVQPRLNLTGSSGSSDETRVVILEAKAAAAAAV